MLRLTTRAAERLRMASSVLRQGHAKPRRRSRLLKALGPPLAVSDPFLVLLALHGLPAPQLEYVFSDKRKFRADYAWPAFLVIVERSGGLWIKGSHSTGRGVLRDYAKANLAQLEGWLYLQFTPQQLDSGAALGDVRAALRGA